MSDRVVSSALSGALIDLLMKRGMTLTAIAKATGTSKSFMSRVKSQSRSLTIDHLVALEASVGEPLPLLLMDAMPPESVQPKLRPLYEATRKMLAGESTPKRARKRRASAA